MKFNELPDMTAAYKEVQDLDEKKKGVSKAKAKENREKRPRWWDDDGDRIGYEKGEVKKEEVEPETFDEIISELKASGIFTDKELEDLQEISADKLLDASKAADVARGKKAVAGDKEGAKKEVKRASKFYAASATKRKQENS